MGRFGLTRTDVDSSREAHSVPVCFCILTVDKKLMKSVQICIFGHCSFDSKVSMISIASITEMLFQASAQQVADDLQDQIGLTAAPCLHESLTSF